MMKEMGDRIIEESGEYLDSTSHDIGHLKRVSSTALKLQRLYGGDRQVIEAAAFLHDLGRTDTSLFGKDSALRSVELALPILQRIGFSEEKIETVCKAIAEHDQPELRPSTVEGRILKEADFLDGFGARGILRSLLWSGERGETTNDVLERLETKMPARIESLEFPESKEFARKQYYFVELFLSLLDETPNLEVEPLEGKYIIFEGISGTGKETQATKLVTELEERGIETELVFEPTPENKSILREWRKSVDDHLMELFFFISDRRKIVIERILPALKQGKTVIGIRSRISTDVYQTKNEKDMALSRFLHSFVPLPDAIFWLDIKDKNEALRRIEVRGEERGKFERKAKLEKYSAKYREVLNKEKNVIPIDASKSIDEVSQQITQELDLLNLYPIA